MGLAAEERRDIEVVRGDIVADIANVLLYLMDNVGQRLLLRNGSFKFAAGFPRFGQERRLLRDVFLVGFLETCGDDRDFYGVLHRVVHDRAEDDVGVFMRGFLDDRRGFVDFVQRQAGAAGNVDENALSALDGATVELGLSDANSPCLVRLPDSTDTKYVVMPMRL